MIKNYIIATFRNLARNKMTSFLSILGLTFGIASGLLMFLFVQHVLSIDKFHDNYERIFRVSILSTNSTGEHSILEKISAVYYKKLLDNDKKRQESGLKLRKDQVVRIHEFQGNFKYNDIGDYETNGCHFADPSFFKIFNFDLQETDIIAPPGGPIPVYISGEMAAKYFGADYPVNKKMDLTLKDSDKPLSLKVKGIINGQLNKSHLRINFIIPYNYITYKPYEPRKTNTNYILNSTYVKLNENQNHKNFEKWLNESTKLSLDPNIAVLSVHSEFVFLPVKDLYLNSNVLPENLQYTQKTVLWLCIISALLVIIITFIIVINLYIARSMTRINEICIRKTIGAKSLDLRIQFLFESFIFCVISALIALSFVEISLPYFCGVIGESVQSLDQRTPLFYLFLLAITLLLGIISCLFPGYFLSSVNPSSPFRYNRLTSARRIRKFLVLFQLVSAMFLAICSTEISTKLDLLKSDDLGFNESNILVIQWKKSFNQKVYVDFKRALKKEKSVIDVSASSTIPWLDEMQEYSFSPLPLDPGKPERTLDGLLADEDFLKVYEIKLLENFYGDMNKSYSIYRGNVFINEAVKQQLKPDEPLVKKAHVKTPRQYSGQVCNILGVTENFKLTSPFNKDKPLFIFLEAYTYSDRWQYLSIRLKDIKNKSSLQRIENLWNSKFHGIPYNSIILQDEMEKKHIYYKRNIDRLLKFLAIIGIIIASISLLATADYEIKRRTREIGIRKSLGATPLQILITIFKDFSAIILAANLVAWPAAFTGTKKMLEFINYPVAYNPDLSIYFLIGICSIFIMVFTVSIQTVKAALVNPADTLRYE